MKKLKPTAQLEKIEISHKPDFIFDDCGDAMLAAKIGATVAAHLDNGWPYYWKVMQANGGWVAIYSWLYGHGVSQRYIMAQCKGLARKGSEIAYLRN